MSGRPSEVDIKCLMAQLCDPEPAGSWPALPAGCEADVLNVLRRNKAPLLTLQGWHAEHSLWRHPEAAGALERERREHAAQRAEFVRVREAFERRGIRTVLIKSVGMAPSFPYRSDNVDALVPREQGMAAAAALLDLGYVELRNIEEPHKYLFKRFVGGTPVSALHLHEQVGWGTGFLNEDWLWQRVSPSFDDRLVQRPSPEDGLLITIAHAFYEDKEIKVWDLVKVRYCVGRSGFDWDYVARQAGARGWLPGLDSAMRLWARAEKALFAAPRIPEGVPGHHPRLYGWEPGYAQALADGVKSIPARIPFAYSKRHYFAKLAADRGLSAGEKVTDGLRHSAAGLKRKLKLQSQRPMLIALSGVDGSGKTAQAEALQAAFASCDIRANIIWSRGASSPLTDALIRLGKRAMKTAAASEFAVPAAQTAAASRASLWRRPVIRRLWPWALAFDLWRQYMARVAWPLLRGWVVIADRYVADAAAEVSAYLAMAGRPGLPVALRLLRVFSPRPAYGILLRVRPEEALARKGGNEDAGLLAAQADEYDRLAEAGWLVPFDNARPLEEAGSDLVRKVLIGYYRRFHTVLNGLFLSNPRARRADPDEVL